MTFEKGDMVKLKKSACKSFQRATGNGKTVNWYKRIGVITQVRKFTDEVVIKWNDRNSVDNWPIRALEKV